jgi:Putative MetA-pathway of phenol degradation
MPFNFNPNLNSICRLLTVFSVLALPSVSASAADLKNFVSDLYGGNGITLDRFGPFPHDAHFTQDSLDRLSELSSNISSGIGIFSFNSTVSSFTFDVTSGVPVRTSDSLGPLLSERATSVGAGRLNVAMSYSRVKFDEFEGAPIDHLQIVLPHDDVVGPRFGPPDGVIGPPGPAFELDTVEVNLNLDIAQDVVGMFATYGVTTDWDVGVIVPVVHTSVHATAIARVIDNGGGTTFHRFGVFGDSASASSGGSETGIGDVVLRTKYHFLKSSGALPDMAARFQISVPTGDEDNLLGTGETGFEGLLIASKRYGMVTPHLNVGYEGSTDSERENVRYVAGFDTPVFTPKLTAAFEFMGRYFPNLPDTRDHFLDVAVGMKWDPFDLVPINANIIIPVNDDGLRSDLVWSVGLDYTF